MAAPGQHYGTCAGQLAPKCVIVISPGRGWMWPPTLVVHIYEDATECATNFVSALDLARFVELAAVDPGLRGQTIDVGAENLTFDQFIETFAGVYGIPPNARHFPLPLMRIMAHAMRPFNLVMARHVQTGVVIHTRDTSFDALQTRRRFPSIPVTTLAELLRAGAAPFVGSNRGQ